MLPIRTILHATDFSDRAENAFRLACAMARDYQARLLVAHVIPAMPVTPALGAAPPEIETEGALQERFDRYVGEEEVVAERFLLEGDPPAEILRLAEDTQCDLIVLGTHGWTGLSRLLMGSVAEQVVRRASCPVLTVRTPFPVSEMAADRTEIVEAAVGI